MRFFITSLQLNPILYKVHDITLGDDIDLLTLLPISENFSKEYTDSDIITISYQKNNKEFGHFTNNVFTLDINIRELDFTNIEQFIYYITNNNVKIVKWFLEAEINVNQEDQYGNYPIMYVKDFYILKMLINSNAQINTMHKHSDTLFIQPIYYFIIDNFDFALYIIKYLIKHGSNVNLLDSSNNNFLLRTIDYEIHKLFINNGLKITDQLIEYYYSEKLDSKFLKLVNK